MMRDGGGHAGLGRVSFVEGISALFLMLSGCSGGPPTVMFDTPNGPLTLNAPAPVMPAPAMPGGGVGPPPGMEPAAPASAQPVSRSGSYTGAAEMLASNGNMCQSPVKITGFHVNGDVVRFGGFRGRIDPDNGLQMVNNGQWIIGQFDGPTFAGQITFWSNRLGPGCTYTLSLHRTDS